MSKSKTKRLFDDSIPEDRICYYCKCKLILRSGYQELHQPNFASCDHTMPKCRKANGQMDCIVLSCVRCNNAKNDMTAEEFFYFLKTSQIAQTYIDWLEVKTRRLLNA